MVAGGAMPLSLKERSPSITVCRRRGWLTRNEQVRLTPPFRAKPYPAPGCSTEAVYTPARVNVTCATPLGEEVAST
jgi:hypothetical protein